MDPVSEYMKELLADGRLERLIELKKEIDMLYASSIVGFKTAEAKYLEARSYGKHYPDFEGIQKRFSQAKQKLYSKPEVREYFRLERELQGLLDEDMNELKTAISNKFSLQNHFKIGV